MIGQGPTMQISVLVLWKKLPASDHVASFVNTTMYVQKTLCCSRRFWPYYKPGENTFMIVTRLWCGQYNTSGRGQS